MLQLLHILDHFDVGAMEHGSADHIVLLAEAMKRMTIDKDRHLGDPAYVDIPVERLLSLRNEDLNAQVPGLLDAVLAAKRGRAKTAA